MELFRLTAPAFASELDGKGGLHVAGRWHTLGHEVLYTSPTVALAVLEVLVQPRMGKTLPLLHLQTLLVPDGYATEEVLLAGLPPTWRQYDPYDAYTQQLGVEFLLNGSAPALKVHSSVVPQEWNYIWSPQRALTAGLRLVRHQPFEVDERLLKR